MLHYVTCNYIHIRNMHIKCNLHADTYVNSIPQLCMFKTLKILLQVSLKAFLHTFFHNGHKASIRSTILHKFQLMCLLGIIRQKNAMISNWYLSTWITWKWGYYTWSLLLSLCDHMIWLCIFWFSLLDYEK